MNYEEEIEYMREGLAELLGFKAGVSLKHMNENPYPMESLKHSLWKKGYEQGIELREAIESDVDAMW